MTAPYVSRRFIDPRGGATRSTVMCILLGLGAVAALLVFAWREGYRTATRQQREAQRIATARSDSLQRDLRAQLDTVHADTVVRDSIITRWRTARAAVETLPPITLPGRVDTLRLPAISTAAIPLIHLADTTIRGLEDINRRCASVLLHCETAVKATTTRAELAEAHAARLEAAAGRAARWRAFERGACAASAGVNLFTLLRK